LNKKLANDNIDITVNSVHPGIIKTEFHFLMILTIKQIAQK
jgi:NAD(P)-dependent dehydrogenase (short-subunit alcohol dehydrogenase family)